MEGEPVEEENPIDCNRYQQNLAGICRGGLWCYNNVLSYRLQTTRDETLNNRTFQGEPNKSCGEKSDSDDDNVGSPLITFAQALDLQKFLKYLYTRTTRYSRRDIISCDYYTSWFPITELVPCSSLHSTGSIRIGSDEHS